MTPALGSNKMYPEVINSGLEPVSRKCTMFII